MPVEWQREVQPVLEKCLNNFNLPASQRTGNQSRCIGTYASIKLLPHRFFIAMHERGNNGMIVW